MEITKAVTRRIKLSRGQKGQMGVEVSVIVEGGTQQEAEDEVNSLFEAVDSKYPAPKEREMNPSTCPICESAEHLKPAGFPMRNALHCRKCHMTFTRKNRDKDRREHLEYLERTGRRK